MECLPTCECVVGQPPAPAHISVLLKPLHLKEGLVIVSKSSEAVLLIKLQCALLTFRSVVAFSLLKAVC